MLLKTLSTVILLLVSAASSANEADIQKAIEARLGVKVESVNRAGYFGLYEVYADGSLFYTDEKVTAILIGGRNNFV